MEPSDFGIEYGVNTPRSTHGQIHSNEKINQSIKQVDCYKEKMHYNQEGIQRHRKYCIYKYSIDLLSAISQVEIFNLYNVNFKWGKELVTITITILSSSSNPDSYIVSIFPVIFFLFLFFFIQKLNIIGSFMLMMSQYDLEKKTKQKKKRNK